MLKTLPTKNDLNALVPISRFNRGEAGKIFDEVDKCGYKIVVKNNAPAGVLLSLDRYNEMLEEMEDEYLIALVEERRKHSSGITIPAAEVYAKAGITEEMLEDIPMVYGVDWE
ncbi:MAG: type II toxin-antitoxin system Phd/YefM family antitoxin [Oscillospiraceae bacterium]|jgi:PHD/YefM family antitoxin component YafN of YafNO toxin-antitoxin module|nr:type II toxin-antitoxin system Phd/YefM family antitoxin [Oscillospiraceae bacterium]